MDSLTDYSELRANPSKFVKEVLGLECFSYQQDFLDTDSRFRGLVSGRQIGKTRMCAWDGLHGALTEPHSMTLITAPSLRQSSLLFKQLRSEMSQSGINDDTWGVDRDTQTVIEFDNGSEIHCLPTGRNGNQIRGFSADNVIVDEAAFINEDIFNEVLEPMILATNGSMTLASTPFGTSGYFYDKVTQWATDGDDDYYSTWSPEEGGISSWENPLIDEDDVETFKEGKTKRQIKQEVKGQFVEDASQFFESGAIKKAMEGGSPETNSDADVYLGVDIAAAGGAETVLITGDEYGNIKEPDVLTDAGVLDAAERIKALDRKYDYEQIVIDETGIGRGTAEDLARDVNIERKLQAVYLSIQKKQTIYQGLKAALEAGDLYLPQNKTLRMQLDAIDFNTTSAGNLSIHADSGNDDYADALALCVMGMPDTMGGDGGRGARGSTRAVLGGGQTRDNHTSVTNGGAQRRNSTRQRDRTKRDHTPGSRRNRR